MVRKKNSQDSTFDELDSNDKVRWGTVVKITSDKHRGRIGYYDDDDCDDNGRECAVVYFGSPIFGAPYVLIPHRHLIPVTTSILMKRYDHIFHTIGIGSQNVSASKRVEAFNELFLIQDQLYDRFLVARFKATKKGKNIFISHSSLDKEFALWLSVDLANSGHSPWLDEWKIRVGESIPSKISEGIKGCDAVLVVLSERAVKSRWVENEWQAKYWDEINEGGIKVLPVLLRKCDVPTLLKTKKYADFTEDYDRGLEELLAALK